MIPAPRLAPFYDILLFLFDAEPPSIVIRSGHSTALHSFVHYNEHMGFFQLGNKDELETPERYDTYTLHNSMQQF